MGRDRSFYKEKWLRKYLELPYGVPTDDTFRLVIGNINTEHFFELTVQLLMQTVDGKGDYVLALKGNQPLLYEEVQTFFDETKLEEIWKSGAGYKKSVEKEHGGMARREYYISSNGCRTK
ncbi:MAG: hypothetical protein NC419_11120 [Muribaculaceae bacterium]|nr:hypothetical protein [Muribaculaceae bacterium]